MQNINIIQKKTRIVKYLFLLSGTIVLFLIFISYLNKKSPITKEESKIDLESFPKEFSLSINNSVFEGLSKKGFPYKILAKTVTKENNDIYNLGSINADYKIAKGNLEILANSGKLDESTKNFTLHQNVKITFDGLVITSEKIDFDLNNNSALSKLPVQVNFKNSTVKASRFNTSDAYNIINFEGKVVSVLSSTDSLHQSNRDSKIEITSERLSIDNNDHIADFNGAVTVFFEDMILKTDQIKIYYDQNSDNKTITKIEIPGKLISIKTNKDETVIADSGEYVVATNMLTLKDNVIMNTGENVVITDKMVYVTKYKGHEKE